MVQLCCVACGCEYEEKRFLWEANSAEDLDDLSSCGSSSDGEDETKTQGTPRHIAGDVARGTGTAANLTGALAPAAHAICGPLSFVGGMVGTISGSCQLHKGLNAPSGIVDPHLVSKGGVTTGVGTTCATLGLVGACSGAGAAGPLFVAALVLGLLGFGTATAIDANVDGLCEDCYMQEPSAMALE